MLAGIGARYTAEAVELARDAERAGADGIVVFPIPAFAGEPLAPEVPYEYHRAIADAVPLPMVLFQLQPALAGVLFSRETLLRLIEIPNVVAIKEASFDAVRFVETRRMLDEAPRRIQFLTGNDNFILESFVLGRRGRAHRLRHDRASPSRSRCSACVAQWRHRRGASRINDAVVRPLADALFAPPVRNYRARLKEALRQLGVIPNAHMRPPLLDLDARRARRPSSARSPRVRRSPRRRGVDSDGRSRLGIGVIGAGGISHSHLLAYRSRANRDLARVVAIADIDEARAQRAGEAVRASTHVFTDYRELLAASRRAGRERLHAAVPARRADASPRCAPASTCSARSRSRRRSPASTRSPRPSAKAAPSSPACSSIASDRARSR